MKKFVTILAVALIAMSCVFAASFDKWSFDGTVGYGRYENVSAMCFNVAADLECEQTAERDNVYLDFYGSVGIVTDFTEFVNVTLFVGPEVSCKLDNGLTLDFVVGMDSVLLRSHIFGVGALVQAQQSVNDNWSVTVGVKYSKYYESILTKSTEVFAGATYTL